MENASINSQLDKLCNNLSLKKHISFMQQKNRVSKTYNIQVYGKAIEEYKKIIVLTSGILNKISSNSLENSYATHWLLKNGYFSYKEVFKFTQDKRHLKDINGYFGIDITRGYGNDKTISSLGNDLNNKRGFFSNYLVCSKKPSDLNNLNNFEIYIINLLCFQGCYYGYDIINNEFYEFKNPFVLCPLDRNKRNEKLYYLPIKDIILNDQDFYSIVGKIRDFENSSCQTPYHLNDIRYLQEIVEERIYKIKSELEPYKVLTKEYSRRINLSL